MKIRSFILFASILQSISSFSQIPNYSFEYWTDSLPDLWSVNSSPPLFLPVSQSTDAHTGSFAIQGLVVNDSGVPFAPYIETIPQGTQFGFPVFVNYDTLYGYYKSNLLDSDLTVVEIYAYDSLGNTCGLGTVYLGSSPNYNLFAIPITYNAGSIAVEMSINMQIVDTNAGGLYHAGSYFIIDDLSFQVITTGAKPLDNAGSLAIFPNPASSRINISGLFQTENKYEVRIYNSLGSLIYENSLHKSDISMLSIDVNDFSEGFYFIVISDDKKYSSHRLIISR